MEQSQSNQYSSDDSEECQKTITKSVLKKKIIKNNKQTINNFRKTCNLKNGKGYKTYMIEKFQIRKETKSQKPQFIEDLNAPCCQDDTIKIDYEEPQFKYYFTKTDNYFQKEAEVGLQKMWQKGDVAIKQKFVFDILKYAFNRHVYQDFVEYEINKDAVIDDLINSVENYWRIFGVKNIEFKWFIQECYDMFKESFRPENDYYVFEEIEEVNDKNDKNECLNE